MNKMDIGETIQRLEERLRENPKSLLFARLADLYLHQERIDEAIDLCLEGVQHHPSYVTGNQARRGRAGSGQRRWPQRRAPQGDLGLHVG